MSISILVTVAIWYALNISVVITNRQLQTTGGLRAPVSLTLLHMICSSVFANSAVYIFHGRFVKQRLNSPRQVFKVLLLTVTFTISILCGVAALGYIPVSFKEMIAATTPLFTAAAAVVLSSHREGAASSLALLLVAMGAIIATEGEPMWDLVGFSLGVAATVSRGLKSVLQHILLSSSEDKLDSMNLLRYMSTFAVLMLVPGVLILEGPTRFLATLAEQARAGNTEFMACLSLNVASAFLVNLFQFLVTKCVGPTVLQVLGNFKGVLCAFLSILLFRNPVTVKSVGGFLLTTGGVFLYTTLNHQRRAAEAAGLEGGRIPEKKSPGRLPIDASRLIRPSALGAAIA
uniref:Solute carrier family 35 member e4 n=2 Tax=Tetraselmis sp. GSL018 TaxID=582737 RepID=A0A061R9V5_9CHLO